ncbi:extensin-like [Helianthus annuus]|uniref:extensin-like n=1 Tax=Helianthus annuus TaxID=4232 RepID=UPI000B8F6DA9|nr:extensin-like [Helianthus annuus]
MAKHLKMLAESDSEDEKAKKKKKKIKTPVSSDDETVPIVRRKMKETPKFEINEEAIAKKSPITCENCEIVFNPKVQHIFGKMIDRKVKGVKELYEKKRKGSPTAMPPRVRGRGKGPMRGGPSTVGPSHRRTPSASFSSSDSHNLWGHSYEPARHSISLSSSPSFHPSFGPPVADEPRHSHHSQHSHHSHESHQSYHSLHSHSFHHSDSTYSSAQFNPNDYVNDFLGYNPLGPEDHFSQEMELDDDPDPEMQTGTPGHPISISSGSPFQGSPYRGPDSFQEKMATYDWYFTPSYHSSPAQPPLIEPQLQAVSPPPLPVEEPPQQPPQPPPEPLRRRRNARISVQGGPRFSSPQGSSSYPPIPEDPQMGGPSNAVPENDPPPASYAPPQPPMGFDNPISTYPGSSGYTPFENPMGYPSDYGTHDPYLTAAEYHHLYPSSYSPVYPIGYPVQGYQYPPYQQPPPPQQQQQTQEILERLDRVEHEGLANLLKGKKK